MQFFAHDGKTTHGPSGIDELLKLPGFDGDTLICPVGSNDTADWKPAMAYPPFKKALLESVAATPPAPAPSAPPMRPLPPPPPPAPVVKTVPCPSCKHANLLYARFCNACAARMDGTAEPPKIVEPPKAETNPFDMPSGQPPFPFPIDAPKTPAPFAHLDPMMTFPVEPAPDPRPLQPGKMGQLSSFEEQAYSAPPADPALAPDLEPAAAVIPAWKRPLVLAAFAGAAVVASAAGYLTLKKPAVPVEAVAELEPSAPAPVPEPALTPVVYTPPPVTSSPLMPAPRQPAAKKAEAVPPLEAPGAGDTFIESTAPAGEQNPLLEALLSDASDRALSSPPPGIEDLPAKSAEGDSLALMQVHEQFDFCSQLLTQSAFGDHYDTCLCKETREAAPVRGRRGFYVTVKKKESGAGQLETTAKILTLKLAGGVASVTARWKASGSDKGLTSSQTWKLEDGLWCQAP